jgi:hypothetical protein
MLSVLASRRGRGRRRARPIVQQFLRGRSASSPRANALAGQGLVAHRAKTAAVILGSAAAKGTPIALPSDTPQNPNRPARADAVELLEGVQGGPPLGNGARRALGVVAGDLRADRLAATRCRMPATLT